MEKIWGVKEITNVEVLYREWGNYITGIEQYARALPFYDKAISKSPEDIRCLLGRGWARAKVCDYEKALEDLEHVLKIDKNHLGALAHKALTTYLICEFEKGLVQNTRLVPLRKKPDNFVMGIMHCTDAIENCLGDRCGRPLRDHFKIIRRLAWQAYFNSLKPYVPSAQKKTKKVTKNLKSTKKKKTGVPNLFEAPQKKAKSIQIADVHEDEDILDSLHSRNSEDNFIPPYIKSIPYKPLQRYTTNIDNYVSEKYLDALYLDKINLQKIIKSNGVMSPNKKGAEKIRSLAKAGFNTVSYKQELLRARRPFYYIKYHEVQSSGQLKLRQENELNEKKAKAVSQAEKIMRLMNKALEEKQLKQLLKHAENLRTFCENIPKSLLKNREQYMNEVYTTVCQGFYDLKRLNPNQYVWDKIKRIYVMFGLPMSRSPSQDSVIDQFKDNLIDYSKSITKYQERLKTATCSNELAWLYHELARFHAEVKQYELSRAYARKCVTEGRIMEEPKWVINGIAIIIKDHIQQSHKNDAKNEVMRGIDVSREIGDPVLIDFMTTLLDVVDKIDIDDISGNKELEKREKEILGLFSDAGMQSEAAHLFRMMSTLPAARRMSVMPGIKLEDDTKSAAYRKMSIMPGKKASDDSDDDEKTPPRGKSTVSYLD